MDAHIKKGEWTAEVKGREGGAVRFCGEPSVGLFFLFRPLVSYISFFFCYGTAIQAVASVYSTESHGGGADRRLSPWRLCKFGQSMRGV